MAHAKYTVSNLAAASSSTEVIQSLGSVPPLYTRSQPGLSPFPSQMERLDYFYYEETPVAGSSFRRFGAQASLSPWLRLRTVESYIAEI